MVLCYCAQNIVAAVLAIPCPFIVSFTCARTGVLSSYLYVSRSRYFQGKALCFIAMNLRSLSHEESTPASLCFFLLSTLDAENTGDETLLLSNLERLSNVLWSCDAAKRSSRLPAKSDVRSPSTARRVLCKIYLSRLLNAI